MTDATTQILVVILPVMAAGLGYCVNYFVEKCDLRKRKIAEDCLKIIQNKLQNFYFPLYTNLARENLIWTKLIQAYPTPPSSANPTENNNFKTLIKNKGPIIPFPLTADAGKVPYNSITATTDVLNSFKLTQPNLMRDSSSGSVKRIDIIEELDKENLKIHLENQKIIQNHLISVNPDHEFLQLINKYEEHITLYNILRKLKGRSFPAEHGIPFPKNLLENVRVRMDKLKSERNRLSGIEEDLV